MRRPLPTLPRGPRRTRSADRPVEMILACPRVSPEWELKALRALIKPHDFTRNAIAHRKAGQPWSAASAHLVEQVRSEVREKIGFDPRPHFPQGGDFHMMCRLTRSDIDAARAFALAVSRRLPGLWLTLDRVYVRDGRFHRRTPGKTFRLVETTTIHLPRPLRAALRDCL